MARGGRRRPANLPGPTRPAAALTLREEKTGKSSNRKRNSKGLSVSAADMLKIEHLEFCAAWAAGDAKIPPLAAHYGQCLARARESAGAAPNNALFQCHRCETVLIRDVNCSVRAKKNKAKSRQISGETPCKPTPSFVVYKCGFCSYGNLKRDNTRRRLENARKSALETTAVEDPVVQISAAEKVNGKLDASISGGSSLPSIIVTMSESPTTISPAKSVLRDESMNEMCSFETTPILTVPELYSPKTVGLEERDQEKVSCHSHVAPILTVPEPNFPKTVGLDETDQEKVTCPSEISLTLTVSGLNSPKRKEIDQEKVTGDCEMNPSTTSPASNSGKPAGLEQINQEKNGINETDKPVIPASKPRLTLLDSNKRKRKKSTAKKPGVTEEEKTIGTSGKRKRKKWTSLEEIANEEAKKRALYVSPIPFSL